MTDCYSFHVELKLKSPTNVLFIQDAFRILRINYSYSILKELFYPDSKCVVAISIGYPLIPPIGSAISKDLYIVDSRGTSKK